MGEQNQAYIDIKMRYDAEIASLEKHLSNIDSKLKASMRKNATASKKLTNEEFDYYVNEGVKAQKKLDNKRISLNKLTQSKINKELDTQNKKAANSFTSKWKKAFGTLTRYMSAGMILNNLWQGLKTTVVELLNVEQAMFRISAITNTTVESTSKLVDTIYRIGTTYGKSISDVTKFTIEMAKLGKTTEEIDSLATSTAALSLILGEDMVSSGTVLVTTMNQFGLVTSEASRVSGVFNDVIKNSPIAIDDLKTSLQYAGVAASSAGIPIERLGEFIKKLSNSGLKASKIGTGLRNIILKLSDSGRSFNDVMDELYESGITLEKSWELFGKRGATAGFVLLENWNELRNTISDIPSEVEQMSEAIATAGSTSSEFAKIWNNIKGVFDFIIKNKKDLFPDNVSDTVFEMELLESASEGVNDILREMGYQSQGSFDVLYDNVDGVEKVISKLKAQLKDALTGGSSDPRAYLEISKLEEKIDELEKLLKTLKTADTNAKHRTAELARAETEYTSLAAVIVNKRRDGLYDDNTWQTDLDKVEQFYTDKLISIMGPTDEAYQKADKFGKRFAAAIMSVYSLEIAKDFNLLKKEIDSLNEKVFSDDTPFDKVKELEKRKTDVLSQIKFYCESESIPQWIRDLACAYIKKNGSGGRQLIDAIISQYKFNIAQIENEIAKLNADGFDISDVGRGYLKDLRTPEDFFGGDYEEIDIPKYKEYLNERLILIRQAISEVLTENLSILQKEFQDKSAETGREIQRQYAIIISPDSTHAQVQTARKEFQRLKVIMVSLYSDYIKDIDKVKDEHAKTSGDADAEILRLLGLLEVNEDDIKKTLTNWLQAISKGIGYINDAYNTLAEERMAQLERQHDAELASIKARYETEGDILSAQLENNLITEGQYQLRRIALEKKRIEEENKINKAAFDAEKKQDKSSAIVNGIAQAAQAFIGAFVSAGGGIQGSILGAISSGIVLAKSALQVSAIDKREFIPVKYAEGGVISGASHKNGGVPFTVSGKPGFEAEGGEFIVNKASTKANLPLLNSINNSTKYNPTHFADGGQVPAVNNNDDIMRILNNIKVRAYFTNKDLDAASRNNTKITKRTTI